MKTAYAAEEEGGLTMELGNSVTESSNSMALITSRAIDSMLKKHEKAENSASKSPPHSDIRETPDQAALVSTPEQIIARYNAGERVELCSFFLTFPLITHKLHM